MAERDDLKGLSRSDSRINLVPASEVSLGKVEAGKQRTRTEKSSNKGSTLSGKDPKKIKRGSHCGKC